MHNPSGHFARASDEYDEWQVWKAANDKSASATEAAAAALPAQRLETPAPTKIGKARPARHSDLATPLSPFERENRSQLKQFASEPINANGVACKTRRLACRGIGYPTFNKGLRDARGSLYP